MAQLILKELSEFYGQYLPLENADGLYLFDADKADWHGQVLNHLPLSQLWSYCSSDVDGTVFITPGRAAVNVLGYVLATVPRTRPEEEQLQFQSD